MVSLEKGAPIDFVPGEQMEETEEIDMKTARGIKWVAKLGSESYGNTTVGGGKVLAGTNNQAPRDPKHEGDRGVVYCFDEATGDFLWQLVVPKLEEGQVCDWEFVGICSSPTVDGTRVYAVTNRCEVICLDVDGFANGNNGPFKEEGQYTAGPGNPPMEAGPTDADILWVYDMRDEVGVFPHNIASSSILVVGDRLYVTTSNGQDWTHANTPFPLAPALVCLDKNTGELLGRERSGICERLYHCNWSSPAWGSIGDKEILVFGAGDGFCYGFNPVPVERGKGEPVLEEIWRYDCNPPHYKVKDGEPIQYMSPDGPSEICATPVFWKGRVYVGTGQDPENGTGVGILNCIDATANGDVTDSGKVWSYEGINRTLSTASVADGLVFVGDIEGKVHCLDAETGEVYWVHDTGSQIWGSTLWADGKIYAGNEDGILTILAAGKEEEVLAEIEFDAPIYSSPVFANGVLYVSTQTHLYAIPGSEE
jgi:outer membrane protein assembly factor BamB